MSSETERITNEVLSRHEWDKLRDHLNKASFESTKSYQRTADALRNTNRGSAGSGEAVLEPPPN